MKSRTLKTRKIFEEIKLNMHTIHSKYLRKQNYYNKVVKLKTTNSFIFFNVPNV